MQQQSRESRLLNQQSKWWQMMAVRCLISKRCLHQTMCISFRKIFRHLRCFWKFIEKNRYRISIAFSLLFAILNIITYSCGCQGVKSYLDPVQLTHGYVPVFPHHYFHKPSILNYSDSMSRTEKIDIYLHNHVAQNILAEKITPVVHVIWCDKGPFTFTHFLSVLSAFKTISPSVLNLHLIKEPDLDPDGYFQFLPDLERDLPPLVKKKLENTDACYGDYQDKLLTYLNLLGTLGGVVIDGRTVISPSKAVKSMLKSKITVAVQANGSSQPLIVMAQSNVLKDIPSKYKLNSYLESQAADYLKCETVRLFSIASIHPCAYVDEDIFPIIIFNSSSDFDHLARWIAYGTSKKLVSMPAEKNIVPNIVHYVWLGERTLDFFSYLSLLSSLHVLNADAVYIHGNSKPLGNLWKEAQKNTRVKFVNRDFPDSVYGEPIKLYASHASDYLRADILLRYGGIYADWDVIFLQKLPTSLKRHNTTANVDWPETGAFPDVFNLGVLVAAPGAPYLRHFLESYRWYLDRHWSYNAIHMPYKVYEKQPHSLNINRHLQILCANDKCHAPWLKDYKTEEVDHLNSGQLNWHTDALAIHWTHPDPVEFKSKENLLQSTSITGEIGKFVLKKAKLIL
ncbi:uncharacterized protein LOC131949209 isoform X2 [Physella acuta]|uniref:uncharacterized protein LOC131949209 isoform X2 n=1 Tax=Physella acuta TaxID=109671 RepID=UPI0027DC462D|nr:uncharacterized protein LOC131949209 isoform X2 [Physella acuta]